MRTRAGIRKAMFLNGWRIPTSMEWLFWPMGSAHMEHRSSASEWVLASRFTMVNRDAFMATLKALGAVREQKNGK